VLFLALLLVIEMQVQSADEPDVRRADGDQR